MPDALGSVRQAVEDATAAVVAARAWSPYGVESGGAQAGLGYTGEWFDASVGLQYLRARWYDVQSGRFTSSDPLMPDYLQPGSIHRYTYVESRVINSVDPRGLSPEPSQRTNHLDLTLWLYNELTTNSNSYYIRRIYSLWNSIDFDAPSDQVRALAAFALLVKDRAKWDFKHEIRSKLDTDAIALYHWSAHWYERSLPGNIHYGFVGRAAGFDGALIHAGASVAEIRDPSYDESSPNTCCPDICFMIDFSRPCIDLGCFHIDFDRMEYLFDDPTDWSSVELGIQMYDAYGSQLTLEQFKDYLAFPGNELTTVSPIPSSVWGGFKAEWPYEVGYFNGPEEKKNEPWVRLFLAPW